MYDLISKTVFIYAKLFESSNVLKAKVQLLSKISTLPQRKSAVMKLGIKVGVTIMLVLWNLFNILITPEMHLSTGMQAFIPVYRALGGCIFMLWLWGFNVWVWSRFRINHVFIFEFNPRSRWHHFQIWNEVPNSDFVLLAFVPFLFLSFSFFQLHESKCCASHQILF